MPAKKTNTITKRNVKPIIMISGPVGAGKTTVARKIVAAAQGPVSYIEGDTFWSFIAKGRQFIGRENNFKMGMIAMTSSAMAYALYGYEVVLDYTIPPWFLDTAKKILKLKDVPFDYVVLRPNMQVCATRAATRSEGVIADYTNYQGLYDSFNAAERYIIKDDASDPVALASVIREGLNTGKFRYS